MKTVSRSRQTSHSHLLGAAAAIGLLVFAGQVGAVSLCASSAQDLSDDLAAASDNGMYAGEEVEINLVRGTYKTGAVTGNGPFTYSSTATAGHLIISGGWTANCNDFIPDASKTVLDGKNTTQVLNIQNPHTETFVDFLTIQNGESAIAGGGVAINTDGEGGPVYLYDNIIQNNHTASIGGGFAIDGADLQVAAIGNLVVGNAADGGFGAGFEYSRNGSQIFLERNTIYQNTTTAPGGTGGMYCCGTPTSSVEIFANIFWQNTNFGIDLEGTPPNFEFNDYGTVTGTTTPDSSNLSVNPKFVDADNGNFRLAGNSPLLGAFPASSEPSPDLAGDAFSFPFHGYYDIGAYEDTVFTDHGFESP